MTRRFTFILLLVLASSADLYAQPLADRLPGDTVIYAGWRGSGDLGPAYAESHARALVDESNLPELFDQFVPAAIARLGRDDAEAARLLELARSAAAVMWRHPTAVAFRGIETDDRGAVLPRIALLCHAGDQAEALADTFRQLLAVANDLPVDVRVEGGFCSLTIGTPWAADSPTLVQSQPLQAALTHVQQDAVAILYADLQALDGQVDSILERQLDPNGLGIWQSIRAAFDLPGLKSLTVTAGFENRLWTVRGFVAAPEPRKGLSAMATTRPVEEQTLRLIPASATSAAATTADISRFLDQVRAMAGQVSPEAGQGVDQVTSLASAFVGTNIRTELVDALGDQWACYMSPEIGGSGVLGLVGFNRLRDPAKAERSLDLVELAINNTIAGQMRGKDDPVIRIRKTKVSDLTIHYLAVPLVAPAWTVHDGILYMGLFPQTVVAMTKAGGEGKSILDNTRFAQAREMLGVKDELSSIEYADLQALAPENYSTLLALGRIATGMGDLLGVPAPIMVLPTLDVLQKHLTPSMAGSWTDAAGWHYRAVSPFPGSDWLQAEKKLIAFQSGMVTSILLPSLNRARETANRVKCANNMRSLILAMYVYADGHDGNFPDDLGSLITAGTDAGDGPLSAASFVCPSADVAVPAGLSAKTPEELLAWVNQHSCYTYRGKGHKTNEQDPNTIILVEPVGNHNGDGANVGLLDGHVEWRTAVEVGKLGIEQ
jgi:prepilin-type processing-associated H-X9-DG protein